MPNMALVPFAIPAPPFAAFHVGPFTIRMYALCIIVGIIVAVLIADRRYRARGGPRDAILTIALWAVPFGIVGGRIYHVITTPDPYWGANGNPWKALEIWSGGLGIWGAIALGALGAWIGCRVQGLRLAPVADSIAPALLVAQAIGRLGNWFNQELFGSPTTLPWGLQVDSAHLPAGYASTTLFHPTFLYELIWNLAMAALLIYLDRRFRLGHGRVFWLYVFLYTLGRFWIESLRIDTAQIIAGLRLNEWTSLIMAAVSLIVFIVLSRRYPGRDETVYRPGRQPKAPAEVSEEESP